MTIIARLALSGEKEATLAMARENAEATMPHLGFHYPTASDTWDSYIQNAEPVFWVADDNGQLAGFAVASIVGFRHAEGCRIQLEVLYSKPAYRGSRAAIVLLRRIIDWASGIPAVKEIVGGNENGFNTERTSRFLEKFGFKKSGNVMTLQT